MTSAPVIRRYLAALDSGAHIDPEEWCAQDFRFAIVWGTESEGRQIAGDRAAFEDFLAQRVPPQAHVHHVLFESGDGRHELCAGRTTQAGQPLATFSFQVELAADGRIRQLFAARTTTLAIGELAEV
jgi:ketosteroid isomerase-like protein